MREEIPTKWTDPETGKTHNLQNKTLPVPATFVSNYGGLTVKLVSKDSKKNEQSGMWEPVEGTGCTIRFKGGHLLVSNKRLLKLLMDHEDYQRGKWRPDPEDPTGFWRQIGTVKVQTVQVAVFDGVTQPKFGDLQLDKVQELEKVEPLHTIKE